MPIYEYQCEVCHHHLEALQKISDAPLRKCPGCGKPKLRRLISPPVFRLKGSGWYETDFKSDKENKRNLAVEKDETPAAAADPAAKPADTPTTPKPVETKPDTAKPGAPKPAGRKPVSRPKPKARPKTSRKRVR